MFPIFKRYLRKDLDKIIVGAKEIPEDKERKTENKKH